MDIDPRDSWIATSAAINAMPDAVRKYIHDLEAIADPQFLIQQIGVLKDHIRMVEADNERLRAALAAPSQPADRKTEALLRDALDVIECIDEDSHNPPTVEWARKIAKAIKEWQPAEPVAQHPMHTCGGPMVKNPHPEAGAPGRLLEVGTVFECVPCLVKSRHDWAQRALKAETALGEFQKASHPAAEQAAGDLKEFEKWLRTVCFQKPTPEAYDLAKSAWEEAARRPVRELSREQIAKIAGGCMASANYNLFMSRVDDALSKATGEGKA